MSGQVDSQVFVCISDFAGWPQVGKLLKGFTLLPNFLLHKRGTITTSNLVGISIVSTRCFFSAGEKGLLFCSESPYLCASPSTYGIQSKFTIS